MRPNKNCLHGENRGRKKNEGPSNYNNVYRNLEQNYPEATKALLSNRHFKEKRIKQSSALAINPDKNVLNNEVQITKKT